MLTVGAGMEPLLMYPVVNMLNNIEEMTGPQRDAIWESRIWL